VDSFKKFRSLTYAAILVCFLLPFASVSCPGAKLSVSGLELVRGTTVQAPQAMGPAEPRRLNPEPLAQAAAACAVLGLLLSLVTGSAVRIPFIVTGGAGAVLLFLLKNKLESAVGQQGISMGMGMSLLKFETAFWLALLGFAAVAVISLLRKAAPPTRGAG